MVSTEKFKKRYVNSVARMSFIRYTDFQKSNFTALSVGDIRKNIISSQ